MIQLKTYSVTENISPTRLVDYCKEAFADYLPSRNSVKKAISSGEIRVNNKTSTTGHWVQKNDLISLVV